MLPVTPAAAANAVDVPITRPRRARARRRPEVSSPTRARSADGDRPTRVFAQLVDTATGLIVGNQVTPIEVTLDGERHRWRPLEVVSGR